MFITMKKSVNERIKSARTALVMNQTEFAAGLETSVSLISKIESGELEPSPKILKKISQKFGIEMNWLVNGEGELKLSPIETKPTASSLYQDALYVELKENATLWQQKYNELFAMFSKVLDRGAGLGKYKTLDLAALGLQTKVSRARIN